MRPRTVLLLVCLILGLGLAVRWAIAWAGFIPKPTDYRKATQLTVTYRLNGQPKWVVIPQSQQLAFILDGIQVYSRDESRTMGRPPNTCRVDFAFPDGTQGHTILYSPNWLDRPGWEAISMSADFYNRLQDAVTEQEGRPINLLADNPDPRVGPMQAPGPLPSPGGK